MPEFAEPVPGTDDGGAARLGGREATVPAGQPTRRVQRTVNFDHSVLERARAAATYLAAYEPASGIRSLADIVNPAVATHVAELEQRYNGGQPFRPVYRMPPGRPAKANRLSEES